MQPLLWLFLAICVSAALLFYWRLAQTRWCWVSGILAAAVIAALTPFLMRWIGDVRVTIALVAAMGVIALGITLYLALRPDRSAFADQQGEEMGLIPTGTMMRYVYTSSKRVAQSTTGLALYRESRREVALLEGQSATPAIEGARLFQSAGEERATESKRYTQDDAISHPDTIDPSQAGDRLSTALNRRRWGASGRVTQRPPVWLAKERDEPLLEIVGEDEPEPRVFHSPSEAERPKQGVSFAFDAPMGIRAEPEPEPAAYSLDEDIPARQEGELVDSEDFQRIQWPREQPSRYVSQPEPAVPPMEEKPARRENVRQTGLVARTPPAQKGGSRLGEAQLMDWAFTLKRQSRWDEAAEAFLLMRNSVKAPWLRKQADIERLGALIAAGRVMNAVDHVFEILSSGYELTYAERNQVMEILRRLQAQ